MIISETVLRNRIRSLLLEAQVYPLKKTLEDIEFYRDFEAGEFEQIEKRLRSNWNRGYSKFSQVIKKDVINGEEPIDHILDAIDNFMPYYSRVGPQMQSEIGQGVLASSELRGYVEGQASDKLNKTRTTKRVECRRQVPIREGEECDDFKVVHADRGWTVVYPKTMLGSMSWAVGLADGSEEKYEVSSNGRQIGRVGWCTAAYSENRFPMYAGNMHMYYFVRNSGYDISDVNRRLCITWSKDKKTGKVQIHHKGNATVDANNVDMSEEKLTSLIGQEIVEKMRVDASSRKATSLAEMASKVTLPMVKQDIENLKDDPDLLNQQLQVYAKYVKDADAIRFFLDYDDNNIKSAIAQNKNIPDDLYNVLIEKSKIFWKEAEYDDDLFNILISIVKNPKFRIEHVGEMKKLPADIVELLTFDFYIEEIYAKFPHLREIIDKSGSELDQEFLNDFREYVDLEESRSLKIYINMLLD